MYPLIQPEGAKPSFLQTWEQKQKPQGRTPASLARMRSHISSRAPDAGSTEKGFKKKFF